MARLEYFWLVYNHGRPEDLYQILRPSDNVALVMRDREGGWEAAVQDLVVGVLKDIGRLLEGFSVSTPSTQGNNHNSVRACGQDLGGQVVTEVHRILQRVVSAHAGRVLIGLAW